MATNTKRYVVMHNAEIYDSSDRLDLAILAAECNAIIGGITVVDMQTAEVVYEIPVWKVV